MERGSKPEYVELDEKTPLVRQMTKRVWSRDFRLVDRAPKERQTGLRVSMPTIRPTQTHTAWAWNIARFSVMLVIGATVPFLWTLFIFFYGLYICCIDYYREKHLKYTMILGLLTFPLSLMSVVILVWGVVPRESFVFYMYTIGEVGLILVFSTDLNNRHTVVTRDVLGELEDLLQSAAQREAAINFWETLHEDLIPEEDLLKDFPILKVMKSASTHLSWYWMTLSVLFCVGAGLIAAVPGYKVVPLFTIPFGFRITGHDTVKLVIDRLFIFYIAFIESWLWLGLMASIVEIRRIVVKYTKAILVTAENSSNIKCDYGRFLNIDTWEGLVTWYKTRQYLLLSVQSGRTALPHWNQASLVLLFQFGGWAMCLIVLAIDELLFDIIVDDYRSMIWFKFVVISIEIFVAIDLGVSISTEFKRHKELLLDKKVELILESLEQEDSGNEVPTSGKQLASLMQEFVFYMTSLEPPPRLSVFELTPGLKNVVVTITVSALIGQLGRLMINAPNPL